MYFSCRIPGCDNDGLTEYNPEWLSHAVPYVNGAPSRCTRYESSITNSSQCWDQNEFEVDKVITCRDWVYETKEKTILSEVKLKPKQGTVQHNFNFSFFFFDDQSLS